MKKMKLAVLASALVGMLGLNSCLGGDENTTISDVFLMKVESSYLGGVYFSDFYGVKYMPNKEIFSSEGSFAYVGLQYDYNLYNQTTNSFDVTMLGEPAYLRNINNYPASQGQTTATLDVIEDAYNTGLVWSDNRYLLLPLSYTISKEVDMKDEDKLKAELLKHNFSVYTIPGQEISENGDSLKLYLRYSITGVDLSQEDAAAKYAEEYTQSCSEYRYLSINPTSNRNPKWVRLEFEKSMEPNGTATIDPAKKKTEVRSYEIHQLNAE